jgi:hypothetical protein
MAASEITGHRNLMRIADITGSSSSNAQITATGSEQTDANSLLISSIHQPMGASSGGNSLDFVEENRGELPAADENNRLLSLRQDHDRY